MRIEERLKKITEQENFIENKKMQLEVNPCSKLKDINLENKRGYTLKTLPSNIREVYGKQHTICILNERR